MDEAVVAGGILAGVGIWYILYLVLTLVSQWKVFVKYGEPGWKGLVPIYSTIVEYGKIWEAKWGIIFIIATFVCSCLGQVTDAGLVVALITLVVAIFVMYMDIKFVVMKSKAFGYGVGMAILLVIFPFIANLILGFGSAEYKG